MKKTSHPSTKLKNRRGNRQKNPRKKTIFSLIKGRTDKKENACPYAKMKKEWGTDKNEEKNISSLYENENLKRGTDKKENACPYAKMNKKWGTDKNEKRNISSLYKIKELKN